MGGPSAGTYIRTGSGWLYLAAVMVLLSRKVVGWAMALRMPAELVCTALQMAITQRQQPARLSIAPELAAAPNVRERTLAEMHRADAFGL